MPSLGWNEVAILMTLGTFVMVWVIVMLGVATKLRAGSSQQAAGQSAPWPTALQRDRWLRSSLAVAIIIFVTLNFAPPLSWLVGGQNAMPLIRLETIAILLTALYVVLVGGITVASKMYGSGSTSWP